jgi:hypothetical protein
VARSIESAKANARKALRDSTRLCPARLRETPALRIFVIFQRRMQGLLAQIACGKSFCQIVLPRKSSKPLS